MSKKESKTIIHLEETVDRFEFKCDGDSKEVKALLSIACGIDPNFLRAITEVVEAMKNPELREAVSKYADDLNELRTSV